MNRLTALAMMAMFTAGMAVGVFLWEIPNAGHMPFYTLFGFLVILLAVEARRLLKGK